MLIYPRNIKACFIAMLVLASCSTNVNYETEGTVEEEETENVENETKQTEPPASEPAVCEPVPDIEIWTIQVVNGDCLVSQYQWDDPGDDWEQRDSVSTQWHALRNYMIGWVIRHNKTHGTRYILIVRQGTDWRHIHDYQ